MEWLFSMSGGVSMIPRIKNIKPLENFILYVAFDDGKIVYYDVKYSLQGTTQGRYLTGGVPPVRFSM